MTIETPDSWIERSPYDGPEPECPECGRPADRCGCEPCWLCGWRPADCRCQQCDACGRAVEPGRADYGVCGLCDLEWQAQHQLTYPTPQSDPRLRALAADALRAEELYGVDECERFAEELRRGRYSQSTFARMAGIRT